jgi:hypothetical protein
MLADSGGLLDATLIDLQPVKTMSPAIRPAVKSRFMLFPLQPGLQVPHHLIRLERGELEGFDLDIFEILPGVVAMQRTLLMKFNLLSFLLIYV